MNIAELNNLAGRTEMLIDLIIKDFFGSVEYWDIAYDNILTVVDAEDMFNDGIHFRWLFR